jgi:hypothetical protein
MVKIFSNFDTQLYHDLLTTKQEEFGKKDVIGIRRGYVFFLIEIVPRLLILIVLASIIWIIPLFVDLRYVIDNVFPSSLLLGIQIFLSLIVVWWLLVPLIKLYMDYKLDFTIITPLELISYNQSSLFTRSSKTIKTDNIKTINLDKKGFWRSLLNYGTLSFLSEWDDAGKGELDIFYISGPERVKDEIGRIMSLGT